MGFYPPKNAQNYAILAFVLQNFIWKFFNIHTTFWCIDWQKGIIIIIIVCLFIFYWKFSFCCHFDSSMPGFKKHSVQTVVTRPWSSIMHVDIAANLKVIQTLAGNQSWFSNAKSLTTELLVYPIIHACMQNVHYIAWKVHISKVFTWLWIKELIQNQHKPWYIIVNDIIAPLL